MKIYVIACTMYGPDLLIAAFKTLESAKNYISVNYPEDTNRLHIHEINLQKT